MRVGVAYRPQAAQRRPFGLAAALAVALLAALPATAASPPRVRWTQSTHAPQVVDLAGPRSDGRLVVAIGRRLWTMGAGEKLHRFARGAHGYEGPTGGEAYITVAGQTRAQGTCSFHRDDVYAIDPVSPGVVRVSPAGTASRIADLPASPTGITFDPVGRFGHRLLVTAGGSLYAIDCSGGVTTLATAGPPLEGGIAVAPRAFGRFGGDLIATDETNGRIFAIDPAGSATLVAEPPLPAGGDIGVESAGFVPPGLGRGHAYLADRATPGNPHPGTGSILRSSVAHLRARGVRAGDLLVATEGGARTVRVRCTDAGCSSTEVAVGPSATHAEGHVVFLPRPA